MRSVNVIISALLIVTMFSCNKQVENSVAGNEYETSYFKMDFTGNLIMSIEFNNTADCKANGMYSIVEFNTDGSFSANEIKTGTWEQQDSKIIVVENGIKKEGFIEGGIVILQHSEITNDNLMEMEVRFAKI